MLLPVLLALVASTITLLDPDAVSSVPTLVQPWRSARFVLPADTLTLTRQAACFAQRTIIKQIRPQTTLPYRDALLAPLVPTQLVQVHSSARKRSPAYLVSTMAQEVQIQRWAGALTALQSTSAWTNRKLPARHVHQNNTNPPKAKLIALTKSSACLGSTSLTRARWAKVGAVTARRRTFSQRRSSQNVTDVAVENIRTHQPSLSARTVRQADTSRTAKWRPVLNVVQANTVGGKPQSATSVVQDQLLQMAVAQSYLLLVQSALVV